MKMDLDFTPLKDTFTALNQQSVIVGVLNKTLKTATPDRDASLTVKSDPNTGQSYENSRIKASKGKKISVRSLAFILDKKYGIISDVLLNKNNKELIEIARLLAVPAKSMREINQLRNASIALIKNPILRKDYGNNSIGTIMTKGFNRVAMDTGRLFRSIKAEYRAK